MRGCLAFLIPVLVLLGCGRDAPKGPPRPEGPRPVEVFTVKRQKVLEVVDFTATLEPRQEALIVPRVSGLIERIYVQEGDWVRKGQALAEIEKADYELALRQASASLREAEVSYEQSRRDYERYKELFESRVISQREFEGVRVQYELASVRLERARAAYEEARKAYEETTVRAPFSGVVTERLKEEGERVRSSLPGQEAALLRLQDISTVRATGYLPQVEMGRIRVGMEAELEVDAFEERTFKGRVVLVNPMVDPQSRSFMVKVEVPNPQGLLKGGMFAKVRILLGEKEALVVPREAILREEGVWVHHCFVVKDGVAERRIVEPQFTPFWYVEVKAGLREGEKVIIGGHQGLLGGERVVVKGEVN